MTTIDTHVGASLGASAQAPSLVAALGHWVTSSDHKRIGRLYVGWSLLFAVSVTVIGALLGLERMRPDGLQVVHGDAVLQIVSFYRYALVLAVLAPLFVGIAVCVVPMQIGARAIALPRLAQASFWLWLFGAIMVVVALVGNGGPGGGATDLVDLYLLGLAVTAAGLVAASVSVATTVLTSRTVGMSLDRVPAFSWAALVGSVATLLSLPVAIGTVIYLYVDHTYAKVAFGGNSGLDGHLRWSLSQPQTFVFVVMALGVLAELAPLAGRTRQPFRSVVLGGVGLVSTGVLGAVTQSTHMLVWNGSAADKLQSLVLFLIFNGLPLLGIIVVLASSLLSLRERVASVAPSFVFAITGSLLVLAGAAGHFFSMIDSTDLGGTAFEEGVVLYLVLGGVLAAIGGLVHWSPKLWGRVLPERRLFPVAVIGLFGAIAAAFPLYVAGLSGQDLDLAYGFDYDGPIALWNGLSAVGFALVILALLAFLGVLVSAVVSGEQAPDDPWNGQTLEWGLPSPAPVNNADALAVVNSGEPLLDVKPSQEVSS